MARLIRESGTDAARGSKWVAAAILVALVIAGLVLWLHFGAIEWVTGVQQFALVGVGVGVMLLGIAAWKERRHRPDGPVVSALVRVAAVVERYRRFRPAARAATALSLVLLAAGVVLGLNLADEPDLYPSVCDEYSYLVQAQQIAHGRLWSAPHPFPDFFTTYQLVAWPVYASIYFPGTALWLAPWSLIDPLGGWAWVGPLLAASLAVAFVYLVTAELLDDLAGVAVALLMLTVPVWRGMSMLLMGQVIAAMLGLATIYLFLRWRCAARAGQARPALAFAAAAGFAATWALLSRPVDGLAYALPVVVAVLLAGGITPRLRMLSIAAALAGVVPLAILQLSINNAIAGSPLGTPFTWYNQLYLPGTNYGLSQRPDDLLPPHATAHFRLSYESFTRRFVEDINAQSLPQLAYGRLQIMANGAVSHGVMLAWAPLALLALTPLGRIARGNDSARPDGWIMAVPFPLMWLLYLPYGFFLDQYATAGVPSLMFLLVAGAHGLSSLARAPLVGADGRARGVGRLALLVLGYGGLLALATRGVPYLSNLPGDDWYRVPELRRADQDLAAIAGRAVVFITPPMEAPPEAEIVYNLGVVHPDAARVVRAHDLSWRNVELLRHYAVVQPERRVYHYDRNGGRLTDLGAVADLAALPDADLRGRFAALSLEWRRRYARELIDAGYDPADLPFDLPPDDSPATQSTPDPTDE